jgi:integrase/recombinase XerD
MVGIDEEKLISRYHSHCTRQGKAQKTIQNYESALNIFRGYIKHKCNLLQAGSNKDILEGFHDYLKDVRCVSYARIKIYYSALSHFYTWAEYKGYVQKNVVLAVRKMYVQEFKNGYVPAERKIISVNEMKNYLNSITVLRDKAINVLLLKTGIRRQELIAIDVDDVGIAEMKITLKKNMFHKRSNLVVFFDKETKYILERWLWKRKFIVQPGENALFIGEYGRRMNKNNVYDAVVRWSCRFGLHDAKSKKLEDHFSPHNLRHCFSTYLQRGGMPREFVKELRGDKRGEIIDIYTHIDRDELRRAYLSAMPRFDIY